MNWPTIFLDFKIELLNSILMFVRMDHENSPEDKPKDDITALKDLVRAKELTKVARIRMEKARAKLEQAEEHEKKLSADVKLIIELD